MDNEWKPHWQDRVDNPQNYPVIDNGDGTESTHLMSAEVDEHGNWYVYPNIVQLPNGKLHKFEDTREAMAWNIRHNNVKEFAQDGDAAQAYSLNYKTQEFKDYYNNKRDQGAEPIKPIEPETKSIGEFLNTAWDDQMK